MNLSFEQIHTSQNPRLLEGTLVTGASLLPVEFYAALQTEAMKQKDASSCVTYW